MLLRELNENKLILRRSRKQPARQRQLEQAAAGSAANARIASSPTPISCTLLAIAYLLSHESRLLCALVIFSF